MLFNRIDHLFDNNFNSTTLDHETDNYLSDSELFNTLGNLSINDLLNHINNFNVSTTPFPSDVFIANDSDEFTVKTNISAIMKNLTMHRDPMTIVIPVTICYFIIFIAGILGNVITCIVISRNRSMHTATNYYLFNLAISDLLLLLSGMPMDMYNIWYPYSYPLNQSFCVLQGLLAETSTNATVLTITSFTVERYIAICHPFRQHTMSKLSRAIKFIMAIWFVAFCLAIPQAIQFGVVPLYGGVSCTVKNILVEHAFEVSSFLFFVGPMTLICVLYVLIGVKLRKGRLLQAVRRRGCEFGRGISGQTRVIRMLIAVVVAFFLCWAPFHAQRLMAVYGKTTKTENDLFRSIYTVLTYVSGVLYFMSTCINPLLYSIMSHKFRDAFKVTIARHCGLGGDYQLRRNHTYSALSRCNGMGSFKLTATVANQPRSPYNNVYNNEQKCINEIGIIKNGAIDINISEEEIHDKISDENLPAQILPDETINGLNNKDDDRFRQRFVSVSSQSTLFTTISRVDANSMIARTGECGMNNNTDLATLEVNPDSNKKSASNGNKKLKNSKKQNVDVPNGQSSQSTLGTIAEKLRKKVLLFKSASTSGQGNSNNNNTDTSAETKAKRDKGKLEKGSSVESAHTNTISNSSLQEVDDNEFESTELAKYMGQVNEEIR